MKHVIRWPFVQVGYGSQESRVAVISPEIDRVIDCYVDLVLLMGIEGIRRQYQEICSYRTPDYRFTAFTANPSRNRYNVSSPVWPSD
ncbi:hypothetical protein Aduo_001377 [Ancylostoma duodenale]